MPVLAVPLDHSQDAKAEGGVIRLITGYWRPEDPAREREIDTCAQRNAGNRYIEDVHFVCERPKGEIVLPGDDGYCSEKIYRTFSDELPGNRCPYSGRETYRQLFNYANANQIVPGGVVIVANADISFDETVALLEECVDENTLACISRTERNGMPPFWDVTHPEEFGNPKKHWPDNSQDAWAFRAPIRDFRCDWAMGVLGCDNRLATEAKAAGMRLINPFPAVKAWHVHEAKRPVVRKRPCVGGPFTDVPPTAGLFERAAARA